MRLVIGTKTCKKTSQALQKQQRGTTKYSLGGLSVCVFPSQKIVCVSFPQNNKIQGFFEAAKAVSATSAIRQTVLEFGGPGAVAEVFDGPFYLHLTFMHAETRCLKMKWLLHSCTCKNFEILGYTWISEWLRRCAASKMFVTFDFEIFHLNPDCSAIAALQNAPPPPWSFTTSLEFWPKVATRIFDGAAIRPASILTEQFEGGRFFWGRMAMYLNEMTSRMNNWFGVIRTSKFWMINFLKFATLIPWSLPRIVFFLSKEHLKNWFGFSLFGFVCNSMCSSFPGTL